MTTQDTFDVGAEAIPAAPLSFLFYLMGPESAQEVIEYALDARPQVTAELRDGLNRAINNVAKVSGFRSASLAPPAYILPQLGEEIARTGDLALAVARVWCEGQTELRDAVIAALEEREVPLLERLSPAEEVQVGASTKPIYEALQSYCETHPDTNRNQAVLMFQLLTGVSDVEVDPEDEEHLVAGLLDDTLNALSALPSTAPEWAEVIPEFSTALAQLVEAKLEQRQLAGPLRELLDSILAERTHLLDFFQCDTAAWSLADLAPDFPFQRARERGETLRDLLAHYAPIHDRAPVVAEELERAGQRATLVPRIMAAGESLGRLFAGDAAAEATGGPEDGPETDDAEPGCSEQSPLLALASGDAADPVDGYAHVPPCDIEVLHDLRTMLQDLEEENSDLEHENAGLKTQVKALERQLYESRSREEGWQLAQTYQDQPAEVGEEPELADVNAAVELAMERYPGQLLFQLNAESDARNSDFTRPDRVWRALRWLATDYFTSHLGQNPIGNMNEACRLACDMWYKTSQHETTMTQFPNAYSTRVDGRLIWLREHIGRGTGFDPRYTIRIAFDWDRQLQKVVIGYIGQHQRTSAS